MAITDQLTGLHNRRYMARHLDTLMKNASDEPDSMYGLAARAVQISDDGLTYRYFIRPEARFHDGSRVTAKDASFSLHVLKEKGHPVYRSILAQMTAAANPFGPLPTTVTSTPQS